MAPRYFHSVTEATVADSGEIKLSTFIQVPYLIINFASEPMHIATIRKV